ncbi:catalase [Actinomarinicola tropica]|uniref:Catalase n=1 Tax=Actinomarinicola tropica TaxID=2789776 RepID=A0A5Q2RBP7_9ACTN|nr:catalase [Actinomarinicola tropica]QGG94299.1 catalase [Actinomarinicola tropica]
MATTPRSTRRARTTAPEAFEVGPGGETHQAVGRGEARLTTQQGVPIADDQSSLTVGERGPTLLEDFIFREKMFHFDHERIPERIVHARGYGAHGHFETYESLTDITTADLFQRPGERTPVFVRFSTVAGNKGSFDLARDARGFAVKFYTQEGNWDLVSNNIPVFFIQDAMKFPDLVHSVKQEPDRGFPQATAAHDNFWDFVSLMPESTHMVLWAMSDRAIPRSLRFMEGFAVHTFRFIDADGRSTFVKFHWKPLGGMQSVVWNEAVKINGADPDHHRRDLWDAIGRGDLPEWELGIQAFDDEFADSFDFDVLDPTKIIPEELVPVRRVGKMVLDRVVDNFFAETEQVAFCPANVVPGIGFTNDPLLQGRLFSYLDTQLKRLGSPNFTQLPINAPKCPFSHFQQDGHMAFTNPKGRANYEPNSWSGDERGPREDPISGYRSAAVQESGTTRRTRPASFADHYSQARQFFLSQTPPEQRHIVGAFVFELSKVETEAIRARMVANLRNVDEDLAEMVAEGLGLPLPERATPAVEPIDLPESPALSILLNGPGSFAGRTLGILVTDGADAKTLANLRDAAEAEGARVQLVAPKVGGVTTSDTTHHPADHKVDGGPSVLFDAVAIVTSEQGATVLAGHAPARDWVTDAHAHCKFVAFVPSARTLLDAAGISDEIDEGYVELDRRKTTAARFLKMCRDLRLWDREPEVAAV